ncbi:hypothetical protein A7E78_14000 [Syntrophotalea acetylenivorans]|uniref:ResB-like domain-containing protein n=1 Tax=Syntrophotalea acetylenivorans TaxID=1842532 RepID=A0A1L3GSH2_9BACT|nr:cytochrome c biogenesis protein ResB [Syntrophotalea acetylenivorans]APG28845.1 hypothetical protein A7E78_14000 [Syntrophotalea acetylenivorans]
MPGKPRRSSSLWTFLCSLKLTVATLLLLAATSVLGTVIPQKLSSLQYQQHYGEKAQLLQALQLDDMYHSVWFMALLGLFVLNLVACSLRRLPAVWRTVTRPPLVADSALLRSLSHKTTLRVAFSVEETAKRLEPLVRQRFAGPRQTAGSEQEVCLFAERRRYARFGAYVTHLAILFIILGALIGNWYGFDSFVPVGEGETVTQLPASEGQAPIELGFGLRCDDFSVSYYEGSARPREYRSLLTVLENGQEVPGYTAVPVVVNRPLQYRGLTFYQSSYGLAEMPLFHLQVRMPDGTELQLAGRPGQQMSLADGGFLRVVDYTPAFRDLGGAALVEVLTAEGNSLPVIAAMQEVPEDMNHRSPYDLQLLRVEERYYTGLQVARDPGVPLVWLGCLLLVLGSLSAFSLAHQRLWLTIRPTAAGCEVQVAGSSHRNQPAFAGTFERLCEELATELEATNNSAKEGRS